MQRNWIGRSEGAEVDFALAEHDAKLRVFTTRPDTLFGATYMVLAPEHKLVSEIATQAQRQAVEDYRLAVGRKSDRERTEVSKEKTGVFTGAYAINPVTRQPIPIWIADYVLATYGTGAIMAVPAHDTRDFEFAQAFSLPIVQVVAPNDPAVDWQGFVDDGMAVNSDSADLSLNGLPTPEAKRKIVDWLEANGLGERTINYKLRDWLFSRQRYWGEPFPIIWKRDSNGNAFHEALPADALPLVPPPLEDFRPTADAQPPLARATDWVNLPDGSKREVNTMPQWAGSCWYYLRYQDPRNTAAMTGAEAEGYWMGTAPRCAIPASTGSASAARKPTGVDLYVGGTEHAVLHLLYARFWHKVLFDLGHVSTAEPFFRLVNQGLILGEDGQKMSKSRGNVVNPDEILTEYGADAFRLYEMFMGPLQDSKPWSTRDVEGVYRFLGKVWRLFIDEASATELDQACTVAPVDGRAVLLASTLRLHSAIQDAPPTAVQTKALHACIKKVTEDLDGLRFNTAISAMMIFINEAMGWEIRPVSVMRTFLQLLAPFAPHLAEELWEQMHGGHVPSLSYQPWPSFDPAVLVEDTIEVPVQVNGKLRDVIRMAAGASQADLERAALAAEKALPFIAGKAVKKIVVVRGKLVNIVVG
jgi:leucyl-tRNA synthetase